ncbi:hypothetical protein AeRB84_004524 [Aphanomyces euteiches]|nr:hypothetical protein AeRB84_019852 [Aphanomyces euteiches]KAH9140623.1 hypothetical protein AeRB84_015164 [Aphanomyces euteiches]KAH9144839.1 hypothetical protein AeRB84_011212 [Aphanomyces euteiches]KAH9150397.1 hypothetical protein AeRB84_006741 [Aphanomyces euteiches]KAH9153166.1 hypothetical protein AeRB84_004524 [Aphanomyces euteiches]
MSTPTLLSNVLDVNQVRGGCTAPATKRAYKSFLMVSRSGYERRKHHLTNSLAMMVISMWGVFTPGHFEQFLMAMLSATNKSLKVSTLGGYRSAVKDVYRRKRLQLPAEYLVGMKTLFFGMKRIEVDNDQRGQKESGKQPMPYSLYKNLCSITLVHSDNGFSHLFLTTQWNLISRSKSVETLHVSHFNCADDSVGCVLHKTKSNQEGSGPKDPRHIYANAESPATCWVLAMGIYLMQMPKALRHAGYLPWVFILRPTHHLALVRSNQKARFAKTLSSLLKQTSDRDAYGTHSIRKGVATFACSASTGGPSIVSVCLRCGWSLGDVKDRYFRYEAAGDQYLGRVVAGLPINSADFARLPPQLVQNDLEPVNNAIMNVFPAMSELVSLRPLAVMLSILGSLCNVFAQSNAPNTPFTLKFSVLQSNSSRAASILLERC